MHLLEHFAGLEVSGGVALSRAVGNGEAEDLTARLQHALGQVASASRFDLLDHRQQPGRGHLRDGQVPNLWKGVLLQAANHIVGMSGRLCRLPVFMPLARHGFKSGAQGVALGDLLVLPLLCRVIPVA